MITLIFEAHGTTLDNQAHLSSGHFDVALSELGVQQSHELGERYRELEFDAIYVSDLQRAVKSAEIAFTDRSFPIVVDRRLRECNYGEQNQHPSAEVEATKISHITAPFPDGESYEQCSHRMREFLSDLLKECDGQTIMIIGHRATQYGLEHWINGRSLESLVAEKFVWQPGWTYVLESEQ